jgi:hypothetical protein
MASAKAKDRTRTSVRDEYDFTLSAFLDALGVSAQDQAGARTWSVLIQGNQVTLTRLALPPGPPSPPGPPE